MAKKKMAKPPRVIETENLNTSQAKVYSEASIRHNNSIVEYCRTSICAISGSTAGILGFTGLTGFAFYFATVFILWILLLLKAGPSWDKYFADHIDLLTSGFMGGLFTYILFWTFLYGIVHVY